MYIWRTFTALALLIVTISMNRVVLAADWQCAIDLDNDNALTTEGEVAACVGTKDGPLCPIDAVACTTKPVCPLDADRGCVAGECSVGGSCQSIPHRFFNVYACDLTGKAYLTQSNCESACVQSAQCVSGPPTCPLTGGTCREGMDGSFTCSQQTCTDMDTNPPVVTNINSGIYKDDGRKDSSGMCLDQVMLYSGRTMECRLAGKSTAYKTCCKGFDEIMTDSTGSISEMTVSGSVLTGAYVGTKAAFDTYKATSNIAQATGSFTEAFKAAVDPATLAISLAVSIAIDYFVNNCNPMDMETGIMNASGMCYETGTYCKSEWFGSCVQEAKTYCCFNSKLGRILHEGGRPQLQSFVGVPPTDCRGFFPEEFQYLDFSKIDLSEYYGDLPTASQSDIDVNMQKTTNDVIKKLN